MGEVKEAVKGSGLANKTLGSLKKPKKKKIRKNLIEHTKCMRDELSGLIDLKQKDYDTEGTAAKAENARKLAVLRATYDMFTSAQALMEDEY